MEGRHQAGSGLLALSAEDGLWLRCSVALLLISELHEDKARIGNLIKVTLRVAELQPFVVEDRCLMGHVLYMKCVGMER